MIEGCVELKLVEEQDLPLLVNWLNDPRNRDRLFTPFLTSEYLQKKWFEALVKDQTYFQFMIIRLNDQVKIGTVSLENINYRGQECQLGPIILDRNLTVDAQHELDAVTALIRYAFLVLNLHRIRNRVYAMNLEELSLRKKVGFVQERLERQGIFSRGAFRDIMVLAVLREEWQHEAAGIDIRRNVLTGYTHSSDNGHDRYQDATRGGMEQTREGNRG